MRLGSPCANCVWATWRRASVFSGTFPGGEETKRHAQLWLSDQTDRVGDTAEAAPRLIELRHDNEEAQAVGLFELVMQHGQPSDDRAQWLVTLGGNVHDFGDVSIVSGEEPVQQVQFRVRWITPPSGVPAPLDLELLPLLVGEKPTLSSQ